MRCLDLPSLTLAQVGNTLAYSGGFAYTFVDMAPDYVALYEGIQLFFLALSGLVAPNIVAYLTPHVGYYILCIYISYWCEVYIYIYIYLPHAAC